MPSPPEAAGNAGAVVRGPLTHEQGRKALSSARERLLAIVDKIPLRGQSLAPDPAPPYARPMDTSVDLSAPCDHVEETTIRSVARPARGCEECLKMGGRWVHLRACLTCGHIGCCDSSPHRHATQHFHATRHPIISSAEPGETWCWCYVDERMLR